MVGLVFFVLSQASVVMDGPRWMAMAFAIHGFVFHIVFGKAYSLVPAYFDRQLATAWGPRLHLPLSGIGALGLAVGPSLDPSGLLVGAGAGAWSLGAAIFVLTIAITVRGNLTGRETGTSDANSDREAVDRYANRFVPIVLLYLLVGAYETAASSTTLPTIFVAESAQVSHVLAAGAAGLLVLSIGARLLPRFFVAYPPRSAVRLMLPAGALGPGLIAYGFRSGIVFQLGAILQTVAIGGYAIVVISLYRASDRQRIGLYSAVLGAIAGLCGVFVGLGLALGVTIPVPAFHYRLTLVGFLGLTIIGVLFQFYPPGIGQSPGVNDRTAAVAIGAIALGLTVEMAGYWSQEVLVQFGRGLVLAGSIGVLYMVIGLVIDRRFR